MSEKQIKHYSLDFADVDIYEKHMIVTPKEVNMDKSKMEVLSNIANKHFNSSFGYIGNRIKRNSTEPVEAAFYIENALNLKAIAIVAYNEVTEKMIDIEKNFMTNIPGLNIEIPIETFEELDSAVEWIKNTIY
jgi:hypothetical protein